MLNRSYSGQSAVFLPLKEFREDKTWDLTFQYITDVAELGPGDKKNDGEGAKKRKREGKEEGEEEKGGGQGEG